MGGRHAARRGIATEEYGAGGTTVHRWAARLITGAGYGHSPDGGRGGSPVRGAAPGRGVVRRPAGGGAAARPRWCDGPAGVVRRARRGGAAVLRGEGRAVVQRDQRGLVRVPAPAPAQHGRRPAGTCRRAHGGPRAFGGPPGAPGGCPAVVTDGSRGTHRTAQPSAHARGRRDADGENRRAGPSPRWCVRACGTATPPSPGRRARGEGTGRGGWCGG